MFFLLGQQILEKDLKQKIQSLIYISYRKNFPKIQNSEYTNDVGWGCTFRSAQMLFSNCLMLHIFGDHFVLNEWENIPDKYYEIISLFLDNHTSYLSLHNILTGPVDNEFKIGKWYGPSSICFIMSNLINYHSLYDFHVIHYTERIIYYKEIIKYLESYKKILILLSMRLGISKIPQEYLEQITNIIKNNKFAGIIGGKDNSSLYILGIDNNEQLIFSDPHFVNEYNLNKSPLETYHINKYGSLKIKDLNTSFSIGFYCKNLEDLSELTYYIETNCNFNNPMIHIDYSSNYDEKKNIKYEPDNIQNTDEWELI